MYRNMDNCTGHIPVLFMHRDVLKRWYSETSFRCTFFGTLCWASSDCSQFHMYACLWPSPITRGHPVCLWRWEHLEVTVHGGRQIRTFIAAYFTLERSKILLAATLHICLNLHGRVSRCKGNGPLASKQRPKPLKGTTSLSNTSTKCISRKKQYPARSEVHDKLPL